MWVHKRCTVVNGALKKVEGSFKCKRCVNGLTQLFASWTEGPDIVENKISVCRHGQTWHWYE